MQKGLFRELRERLTSYIRPLKGLMDTKGVKFVGGSNEEGGAVSESSQGIMDNAEGLVLSDFVERFAAFDVRRTKAIFKYFCRAQGDI